MDQIKSILESAGFDVHKNRDALIVSLVTRPVTKFEVMTALGSSVGNHNIQAVSPNVVVQPEIVQMELLPA